MCWICLRTRFIVSVDRPPLLSMNPGSLLVNENSIRKYTTSTGQKTGTLNIENHVQKKLMAIALVAECQNLNSGSRLMKGRNSSSFFVGSEEPVSPSSRPSSWVREGSILGWRKARKRFRR